MLHFFICSIFELNQTKFYSLFLALLESHQRYPHMPQSSKGVPPSNMPPSLVHHTDLRVLSLHSEMHASQTLDGPTECSAGYQPCGLPLCSLNPALT